jgi:hypothetical protein
MVDDGMFVSNRNVKVDTDYGYTIRFMKGEPTYVPPLARESVVALGVMPVNGELPELEDEQKPAEPIGPERKRRIMEAVEAMRKRNNVDDFTAGGVPKESSMQRDLGFRVARREINEAHKAVIVASSQEE